MKILNIIKTLTNEQLIDIAVIIDSSFTWEIWKPNNPKDKWDSFDIVSKELDESNQSKAIIQIYYCENLKFNIRIYYDLMEYNLNHNILNKVVNYLELL